MENKFRVWIESMNKWGYFSIERLARDPKMQHYVSITEKYIEQFTGGKDEDGDEIYQQLLN